MTLSELCIRRPVMTTLITASIIAFGVFGFRLLPVSALPKVDFPTIAVTATIPQHAIILKYPVNVSCGTCRFGAVLSWNVASLAPGEMHRTPGSGDFCLSAARRRAR